jgi:hypothetical protein
VAGQTFADEAELAELLKPVEVEYDTLRAKFGAGAGAGPGIAVGGGPTHTPNASSAIKSFLGLSRAEQFALATEAKKGK